ncbi:hypothetical protein TSAR_015579 [Trichomalopsis sarcophagae]|uniref:Major facilitator superfamily (MFS) profile domain-containing protein n=1 Tax=Trichomalopsis sarcophagae TaxID=543379 RepID=A0A232F4E0_9HYME|nr:hypothetical protein TSAR_015579 [Trichomalopsis sarcophagae]
MGVERGKYASPEGSKSWEYLASGACSVLMFCIGSSIGWNSPSSVKLTAEDSPRRMSSAELSSLMSLIAIGQMLAPPLNSLIVDRIGRKNTILIGGLPLAFGWCLIAMADGVPVLYVARFLAGLSQGIAYCACYMYVGEVASRELRGVANVLLMLMLNLGMLVAFGLGPLMSIVSNAWLNLALSAAFLAVFSLMPESPYYLLMRDRHEEAEAVLEKIRGRSDVTEELEQIEHSLRSLRKQKESGGGGGGKLCGLLLLDRPSLKAIWIIGLFSVTHHFGGYMAVIMYGQRIFRDLGIGSILSDHSASVINGLVQLVSVALTSLLVERWGRKPLIALSGLLSGSCNLFVAAYFCFPEAFAPYSLMALLALLLLVFAFNCGLLVVQGILISELFAPEVKALGVCLVTMNGGLLFTLGTKLYLTVVDTWHYGHSPPFFCFAVVCWSVTGLLLWITPETKGKSLLEIQKSL